MSPAAVKAAERAGYIVAARSRTGRVLFTKEALDEYARGS